MALSGTIDIQALQSTDYEEWLPLWIGNNQGQVREDITAETWNRLMIPIYPVHGLSARIDGRMAGLLHYVLHPVTGHIDPVCYMQDVYVHPGMRRRGVARALIDTLAKTGKSEKWARIYWFAERDDEAAQGLYRNFGLKLDFSLHVLPF